MIYIIVFCICLAAAIYTYHTDNKKYLKEILIGLGIMLTLLAGLRDGVGFDYYNYEVMFTQTPTITNLFREWHVNGIERGYFILNSVLKTMRMNITQVFFTVAAITIILLFTSFKKYAKYPALVVLLYVSRFYFIRDMGQIRASIASAFILFSLESLQKKQHWKFILLIFIGFLFHQIALIGLLLYVGVVILEKVDYMKLSFGLLGISFFVGIWDLQRIVLFFENWIPQRFIAYFISDAYAQRAGLNNPVLIMQLAILFLMLILFKKFENKYFKIYFTGYLISTCILAAFNSFGTLAGRTSTFFATFEVLIIPLFLEVLDKATINELIENISKRLRIKKDLKLKMSEEKIQNFLFYVVLVYAITIFLLIFVYQSWHAFVPYQWQL